MDDIRRDDIRRAMATPPSVKALQALEAMADGIELKRISLREKHPELDDAARDELLRAWLSKDE
jgi:hypothetical protein